VEVLNYCVKSRKVQKKRKSLKQYRQEERDRVLHRAERVWRYVHIEHYSYTEAWKKANPVTKAKKPSWVNLAKRDCDLFEKEYAGDLKKLLEAAGLGLTRVVQEIAKSLSVKKVELYQGEVVRDKEGNVIHFDDNLIQQKGRELLVKIHGLEKMQMEVTGRKGKPIGIVFLPSRKTPEEWMKEHGNDESKDTTSVEASAETE